MNKILFLLSIILLTGCAITQPKAPVVNGLQYTPTQTKKVKIQPQKTFVQTVEKEKQVKQKVFHTVKEGEYIYSIARQYKISPNILIKNNNIKKPYRVYKGDKLYVKTIVKTIKVKEQVSSVAGVNPVGHYSLTRNPKLYTKHADTSSVIKQTLPVQDPNRPSKDKNVDFGYHKVKRGENLFRIGKKYNVSVFDLMAYNDLNRPEELKAGQELKIPVARSHVETPKVLVDPQIEISSKDKSLKIDFIDSETARKKGFVYPLKGRIISKFGIQGHGIRNDGIDIAAQIGTPVRSTHTGKVMYAQNISTLGQMVLIKHSKGYISAYTHNSRLLVKKGQKVAKGQVIALSGNSGNAKQPMLHFELRRYGKAINPTRLLH